MKIAFGPYIGDFHYEVFYFLPFINWVKTILNPEKIYISSHYNREFLYSNIADTFIHIDPFLTADELGQKNHFNKNIFKVKYDLMCKKFKSSINDEDLVHYSLDYNRFAIPCSICQLQFKKLNFDFRYRYSNKIVFIPDRIEKESFLIETYNFLKEILGDSLIVMGDMKTHLHNENILYDSVNYTTNVYKETINAISSCKAVITPASFWTGIANLQGTPVISWGNFICEYKDGKYSFENKGKFYPKLEFKNFKNCLSKFLEEI